jgi:hypothetical protein
MWARSVIAATETGTLTEWYTGCLSVHTTTETPHRPSPPHVSKEDGEVASVLNQLSNMPWRQIGEWRYSSTILHLGTRWG